MESLHRVVAGPLDSVQMIDGHILTKEDGDILANPFPETGYETEECEPRSTNICDFPEIDLPPGFYFVVGDNRSGAIDSRQFGFVRDDWIIGTATEAEGPSLALPDDIEAIRASDTEVMTAISDDLDARSKLTDGTVAAYAGQFAGISEEGQPAAAAFLKSQAEELETDGYLQGGAAEKLAFALAP